jgi:hypothetical protein
VPEQQSAPAPLWHAFVAGAVSGLAARVVTFPADTLKARLQVRGAINAAASSSGSSGSSTAAAARVLLAREGLRGFYSGFGAVLWGVVPANLAYFGGAAGLAGVQRGVPWWCWCASSVVASGACVAQGVACTVWSPARAVRRPTPHHTTPHRL